MHYEFGTKQKYKTKFMLNFVKKNIDIKA